ncbi:MAG: undecaprenyldiphospho-muramoylpentapeptide beta-N-acetylglucosaminyltransferase [Bacteroides sp.]|nr:undecaprenyldiphospho-muramoylpentapeptide beta-N-acetylglucosaminyltransferase [Ruminococcus flavefaciens]MCM1554145.1 undecaprenyldiphospho-muramoylpentapeptide beta-N-acetylglucosaminyltransferase [Bacteroides sp.]
MQKQALKVIISGGGTGGHIFPAIAIANEIKHREPDADILFVGAENRMEMEKVPAEGYQIVGLNVVGLDRKHPFKNLSLPFKLAKSLRQTRRIIRDFAPDVVVGVGGYASAPTLYSAQRLGIPTLIQEQNSLPGMTNRILSKRAKCICVGYDDMERFFPREKIVWTGNPIRQDISDIGAKREEAYSFYNLKKDMPTLLVMGGSLGAGTINEGMKGNIDYLLAQGFQVIWQTGKYYYQKMLPYAEGKENLVLLDFVRRVDLAYAAADIIVSRAGAITISELCVVGKPLVLIPSPNVAEDHQTRNAEALSSRNAAILLHDDRTVADLGKTVVELWQNDRRRELLSQNISRMGTTSAAKMIVDEVMKLI